MSFSVFSIESDGPPSLDEYQYQLHTNQVAGSADIQNIDFSLLWSR